MRLERRRTIREPSHHSLMTITPSALGAGARGIVPGARTGIGSEDMTGGGGTESRGGPFGVRTATRTGFNSKP